MSLEQKANEKITNHLIDNPCRGIVLGLSDKGKQTQICWIMGRSENSQNRKYVVDEKAGIVKTQAFDESKVKDPSLIIYNAMNKDSGPGIKILDDYRVLDFLTFYHVVSNGVQTDAIAKQYHDKYCNISNIKNLKSDICLYTFNELLTTWYCEPDAPIFTPRITGIQSSEEPNKILLSVIKADSFAKEQWIMAKANNEDVAKIEEQTGLIRSKFPSIRNGFVRDVRPGFGYCLTTYMSGSKELPSFEGEPILVPMKGELEEIMKYFWSKLAPGPEGKWPVAIAGKQFTEDKIEYKVMNRLEG